MPTHDEPNLMTVPEVAREMRISRSAVYAYLASGELGSIKIGRSCRVRRSAVEAFLVDRERDHTGAEGDRSSVQPDRGRAALR